MAKKIEKITVVIPARGREALLGITVNNVVASARDPDHLQIIIVDDGIDWSSLKSDQFNFKPAGLRIIKSGAGAAMGMGTSYSRHLGVMAAQSDIIVTVDAHVLLSDGWDAEIRTAYRNYDLDRSICCAECYHLSVDRADDGSVGTIIREPTGANRAAKIHWTDTPPGGRCRPLVAKWATSKTLAGARVPCIMGAFYVFRKKYYEELHCPWSLNRSWGCDEEIISIASALLGDGCFCLPASICSWHAFSFKACTYTDSEHKEVRLNRGRMVDLFPFSPFERLNLMDLAPEYFSKEPLSADAQSFKAHYSGCRKQLDAYLCLDVAGYPDFCSASPAPEEREEGAVPLNAWEVVETDPPPSPVVHKRSAVSGLEGLRASLARLASPSSQLLDPLPVNICAGCGGRNTFTVYATKNGVQYLKCGSCGQRAHRRVL